MAYKREVCFVISSKKQYKDQDVFVKIKHLMKDPCVYELLERFVRKNIKELFPSSWFLLEADDYCWCHMYAITVR
jgi:hypothetical protein